VNIPPVLVCAVLSSEEPVSQECLVQGCKISSPTSVMGCEYRTARIACFLPRLPLTGTEAAIMLL
jgi:hypothetical protein